jgi:hypothetical protein
MSCGRYGRRLMTMRSVKQTFNGLEIFIQSSCDALVIVWSGLARKDRPCAGGKVLRGNLAHRRALLSSNAGARTGGSRRSSRRSG